MIMRSDQGFHSVDAYGALNFKVQIYDHDDAIDWADDGNGQRNVSYFFSSNEGLVKWGRKIAVKALEGSLSWWRW